MAAMLVLALSLLVTRQTGVMASTAETDNNLVKNPSFATASKSAAGGAAHWSGAELFERAVLADGGSCMSWSSTNASQYETCGQNVPAADIVPGDNYVFEADVKTEAVSCTAGTGATVCVQWSTLKGYLGGSYPKGIAGTHDWTHIGPETFTLPDDGAALVTKMSVGVYSRQTCIGKAWWRNVSLLRAPPTPLGLAAALLSPTYRGRITKAGGQAPIRVVAAVTYATRAAAAAGATMTVEATLSKRSSDTVVERLSRKGLAQNLSATLEFKQPPLKLSAGEYAVALVLRNSSSGKTLATSLASNLTRVKDSEAPPKVYVDSARRLVVDGAPFFPIGMYTGGMGEADYERFGGSAAFNMIMSYQQQNATQMDWAQNNGVKVAYTIKDSFCGKPTGQPCTNSSANAAEEAKVKARIREFRDHPATLLWYTNDELKLKPWQAKLQEHQQWVQELDPNHPTWAVLYEVGDMTGYLHTCDIIGSDPYPIGRPGANLSEVREWTNTTKQLTFGSKAIIEVIQAHNLINYQPNCKICSTPTAQQSRSMVWQAICGGANGIVWYSFNDIKRNPDVKFETEWGLLLQQAKEVQALAPILLSDEGPAPAAQITDATGAAPGWMSQRARWAPSSAKAVPNRGTADYILFVVGDGDSAKHTAASFLLKSGALKAGQTILSVTAIATPLAKGRTLSVSSGGAGWIDDFWSAADNAHEMVAYRVTLKTTAAGERRRSALPSPLRGWAFAHRLNDTTIYPNATLNFNPTWSTAHPSAGEGEPSIAAQNARGIACLGWAQCWNAAGSHAFNRTTNRSYAAYFEAQATVNRTSEPRMAGRGLDECNLSNNKTADERAVAAAGFRLARKAQPDTIIAGWGANAGDEVFASLMADNTFDFAMVEGYTYCPGCGDWPASGNCCSNAGITNWQAYKDRLDFAKARGYISRTLFCFGFMLGKSDINPNGWTQPMLRTSLQQLKSAYPTLGGVLMYGHDPARGFPNATNHSTEATDAATLQLIRDANELMLATFPSPSARKLKRKSDDVMDTVLPGTGTSKAAFAEDSDAMVAPNLAIIKIATKMLASPASAWVILTVSILSLFGRIEATDEGGIRSSKVHEEPTKLAVIGAVLTGIGTIIIFLCDFSLRRVTRENAQLERLGAGSVMIAEKASKRIRRWHNVILTFMSFSFTMIPFIMCPLFKGMMVERNTSCMYNQTTNSVLRLKSDDGQLCRGLNNSGAKAPAETDWFFAAKRGVFTHYLNGLQNSFGSNSQGKNSTWSSCVDEFSAEAYAESAAATGANFAVITMMQGSNNLLGPNARYNALTGNLPGGACSKRDLVLDLHAALAKRGLHLLLYWTGDGPHEDAQASAGMGLPGCPGTDPGGMKCRQNIPELFAHRWGSVLQEYAVRYGDKVKGWWVDGCYEYFNYTDAKLKSYHDAIRKGNPRAMMAFNGGANYFPIGDCPICKSLTGPMDKCYSRWNDITNGEADWGKPPNTHSNDPFNDIPTSRNTGGQQWHTLGFIGKTWAAECNGTCRYTAAQFRDYSRKVAAGGGVLTVDLQLLRNGSMNAQQVALLKEAWKGLKTDDEWNSTASPYDRRLVDVFYIGLQSQFKIGCYRIPAFLFDPDHKVLMAVVEAKGGPCGDGISSTLVMRRSTDFGATWLTPTFPYKSWLPGRKFGQPQMVYDRRSKRALLLFSNETLTGNGQQHMNHVSMISSGDGGATWSAAVSVDGKGGDHPGDAAGWAPTSGVGIQMREGGPHAGRLLATMDTSAYGADQLLMSDDSGKSFRKSYGPDFAAQQVNEWQVAELSNHSLLAVYRNKLAKGSMETSVSNDGGQTFTTPRLRPEMMNPTCQGSVLAINKTVLFAGPRSTTKRENMTVIVSHDDGETFLSGLPISANFASAAMYSAMQWLGNVPGSSGFKGEVILLFEGAGPVVNVPNISVARFDVSEIVFPIKHDDELASSDDEWPKGWQRTTVNGLRAKGGGRAQGQPQAAHGTGILCASQRKVSAP